MQITSIQLQDLTDDELHLRLKQKADREREILADVVSHIHEVDRRRLFLKYDYPSLFEYLVKEMGYPGGSAQRRIDAARLLGAVPEIRDDIVSGDLNLTQLTAVAQGIKQKLKAERTAGMSTSQYEKVKESVCGLQRELLEKVKHQTLPQVQKIVAETLDIEVKSQERKTVQQDGSMRVELTLTAEQVELLKRVKDLISHTSANPSFAEVFEIGLREIVKKRDPVVKSVREKARANANQVIENSRGKKNESVTTSMVVKNPIVKRRSIPARMKRLVFEKHRGCQWQHENGEVCGSTFLNQIDHIKSVHAGGTNEIQTCRCCVRVITG